MAGSSFHKASSFIVVLSLLFQSYAPVTARSARKAEPERARETISVAAEESDGYQPPVFEHPQARQVDRYEKAAIDTASISATAREADFERAAKSEPIPYLSRSNLTVGTLQGYWNFDEGSGTIAYNLVEPGAHNGTIINGTSGWVNGRYYDPAVQPPDYALQFNGTNTYVSVSDTFDPAAYTIALWVKPGAVNRNIFVRTSSNGPTSSWSHSVSINSSGYFCAYTWDGTGKTVCGTTQVNTTTPTWYHVASTAANSGQLRLYVNGMEEGTAVSIGTLWTGGDRYYIGSNRGGGFGYFSGAMDEALLYNSALSAAEVQQLYLFRPGQSTVNVSSGTVVADGVAAAEIQVTLKDGDGNPLPGHTLYMNVTGSSNTISPASALTDADGLASFTLKSTKAETKAISTYDQTQRIILRNRPTITFIPGAVSPGKSTVATNLSDVADDGVTPATITVTALDAYNNPIQGASVVVSASGSAVVTQPAAPTDAQGKATATVRDEITETVTVSAVIDSVSIPQTVNIRFHCRTNGVLVVVNTDTCTLNAGTYTFDSLTVRSGGTLILKGNATANQGVTINAPNITVEAGGKISANGNGYPWSSTYSGPGAGSSGTTRPSAGGGGGYGGIGESANGSGGNPYGSMTNPLDLGSAGGAGLGLVFTRAAGAGGGAIHLSVSGSLLVDGVISADGVSGGDRSGGGSGGSILIEAASLMGNGSIHAIGGAGVNGGGSGGGGRIAVYSAHPSHTIDFSTAGGPTWEVGGEGTVYLDALDLENSTVVIAPSSLPADGITTATVTVTVLNVDGYPMSNKPVEIAVASGGGLSIDNQPAGLNQYVSIGYTDGNGQVSAALKTTLAGARTIKARSGQEGIIPQGTVEFVAGDFDAGTSQVTASPVSVPADGTASSTITVTAYDAYNNPVSGANVVLQATGSAMITQPVNPTNSQGKATGQVTNTVGESVTISATVNGVEVQDTAAVTFTGADLSLSISGPASAVPNSAVTYWINVQNTSSLAAQNTSLEIQLPAGMTFVSQDASIPPTQSGQILTWDLGTFDPNEKLSFTLTAQVSPAAAVGETLTVQGSVSSTTSEQTPVNNASSVQTEIVEGHDFSVEIQPSTATLAIGGVANYQVIIKNTGLVPDQYSASLSGLDAEWYTLSSDPVPLAAGGTAGLPLRISTDSCAAAGSHAFEVTVTSAHNQQTKSRPANVTFAGGPQISILAPANGGTLGSRDVTFIWNTDTPASGVLTVYPQGQPWNSETYNSPNGSSHSVVAPDLTRGTTYTWSVEAASDCGSTTSPARSFTVGNGIVFVNHSKTYTIDRDYDQRLSVSVRNEDNQPHTLTSSVSNPYEDIIVNFVDSGSIDETVTLAAGETRQLTLAVHAQDADVTVHTYDLGATLTADEGDSQIQDNMSLRLNVLAEGDFTIVENIRAYDPVTLARTYVITNHGQPVTDLSLTAVDPVTGLPARIYLQPSLDHARIETGQSIRVKAYPLFSADDVAPQASSSSLAAGSSQLSPVSFDDQTSGAAPIEFDLKASGAGVTKSLTNNKTTCGAGRQITPVVLQDCTMTFETKDWYCTNRPAISTPIQVPSFINSAKISSASLSIVYSPNSDVRPHDGQVSFNGAQIGSYSSQIPTGQFSFEIPASAWRNGVVGSTVQSVQMKTQHPNPGHYASVTGYQLNVNISQATLFTCADSPESARTIIQQQYACSAVRGFNWATDIYPGSNLYSLGGTSASNAGSSGPSETDCDKSAANNCQANGGDPINTKTGVFSMGISDVSFPTTAGELIFQRALLLGSDGPA